MDEQRLRSLGPDVEANLELPDFDVVGRRARRIKARRTRTVAAVAVAAVLATMVFVARTATTDRSAPPVDRPGPVLDTKGAQRVLRDPDAAIDPDASRVDGRGDMLAVVGVARLTFGGSGSCGAPLTGALRWTSPAGRERAWVSPPRPVVPLATGFVVGQVRPACRSGVSGEDATFLVDGSGRPHGVTWGPGAQAVCRTHPGDVRCRFRADGTASLVHVRPPPGTHLLSRGGPWWAASRDERRVYVSRDGRSWRRHVSTLPAGEVASASAAGSWAVVGAGTSVGFSRDAGATWRRRDLTSALGSLSVTDVAWTVTPRGTLLGVTELVGRGDVLFRSTDASWSRFVETPVHTAFGLVRPSVSGKVVHVADDERWWVSTDDGAHWRRTPPLP